MQVKTFQSEIKPPTGMTGQLKASTESDETRAHADWVKAHVADYEIHRRIGKGGYGEVWLARDVLGYYRAVKIVRRQALPVERAFEREFDGIKRFDPISRTHPGLVCILHVGGNLGAGYFYYVMEAADDAASPSRIDPARYVPKTLAGELARLGKLPWESCLSLALDLTAGLAHLHNSGLVHRDIKPANIIFVQGKPKLADIGLVTEIGETGSAQGTVGYIPPELHGRPAGDVFSLGNVLSLAIHGGPLQHVNQLLVTEPGADPRLKRFQEVVRQACELNAKKRLQSAEEMHAELLKLCEPPHAFAPAPPEKLKVTIIHQPSLPLDAALAARLRAALEQNRCQVSLNQHVSIGVEAARQLERQIAEADVGVVLLSSGSVQNEILALEVEMAQEAARQRQGRPRLLVVRLRRPGQLPDQLAGALNPVPQFSWDGPEDDHLVLAGVVTAVRSAWAPVPKLEPPYGAVPLESEFYIVREADKQFKTAVQDRESLVLVKGARQMGKTSLLARALQEARQQDLRVVWTDFQKLNAGAFESLERFYLALGECVAASLDLDVFPADTWDARHSPNQNFERYLRREILERSVTRVVWGMDEVDRLIPCGFRSEVFGLLRAWSNERSVDPSSPWGHLTVALSYATEAHLFISNVDMSPFNVGTRLNLSDFSQAQVADLNARYGSPLRTPDDVARLTRLVGGQPFLVRRGLHELASQRMAIDDLERDACRDEGIFGDHLRRLLLALARDPVLLEAMRQIVSGGACPAADAFYRLRTAGLVGGESPRTVRMRCPLYEAYFKQILVG